MSNGQIIKIFILYIIVALAITLGAWFGISTIPSLATGLVLFAPYFIAFLFFVGMVALVAFINDRWLMIGEPK